MEVMDYYYAVSETPLRERIESAKQQLNELYLNVRDLREGTTEEPFEDRHPDAFLREYRASLARLKSGNDATNCELLLKEKLSPAFESKTYQQWFPVATTWLVCADLLEQEHHTEKSWSMMLEYKGAEHLLLKVLDEESALQSKARSQRSGGQSNARFYNLRDYFIEFLETKRPPGGWKTQASAISILAPSVHQRHNESKHSSIYRIPVEDVETKLVSWLKNYQPCKDAYNANKASC